MSNRPPHRNRAAGGDAETDSPASDSSASDAPAGRRGDGRGAELLQFPTEFPIKIMGPNVEGFAQAVADIVQAHAADFDASTMEFNVSRQGNYVGLTATIVATSREQLDALYSELTAHPLVKVVL